MKDNSPVEKTCPKINRVKNWIVESVPESKERESMLQTLEEIRSDNERLSTWGNEQFQQAEQYGDLAKLARMTILEGKPSAFAMEKEKINLSY